MSRAFLILTTHPMPPVDDPSERSAVLAAHRDAALEAWIPAGSPSGGADDAAGPHAGSPGRRTFFGFVDHLGRTHSWPGLLREHRVR